VVFIYLALRRRLSSFLSIWRSLPTFSLPLQQDIPSASPFSRSHFLFLLLLLLLFYKSSSFSSSLRPRRLLFSHGHYACDPLSASIPLTVLVSSSSFFPSSSPPLSYTVFNDTLIGPTALTYLRNHVPLNTRPSQRREKVPVQDGGFVGFRKAFSTICEVWNSSRTRN
jgi:hypothetical protein